MKRLIVALIAVVAVANVCQAGVTSVLDSENRAFGVTRKPMPVVDDLSFLRRVYVDLIGRIPTTEEIDEFQALPGKTRRTEIVEKLLVDERFADRWTTYFSDLLRLRSNADGGAAAIAFVNRSIREGMPYDELCRRMISANGKAGATPEIGFVLGDNADPMALAGSAAQVFMGIRFSCAECHDHPFDKWTRKDFYGFAAYFGKTRRVETRFTNTVYTTEAAQTSVLWPPADDDEDGQRKAMRPIFPVRLAAAKSASPYVARLNELRRKSEPQSAGKKETVAADDSLDVLLPAADDKVRERTTGKSLGGLDADVLSEAKRDVRKIDLRRSMSSQSELRTELARLITDPRNRYFSRCFVNRIWGELVGRGFVEPVDDFRDDNLPSHPKTLDYLADEFVASGFDLRSLVRLIVTSEPYQRGHAFGLDEAARLELEETFLATPLRRMMSEALFDSIVTAGHLFDVKHSAGRNLRVTWERTRIPKERPDGGARVSPESLATGEGAENVPTEQKKTVAPGAGYSLENAIELDFDSLLRASDANDDEVAVDRMRVMSKEEIEAMRMQEQMQRQRPNVEYLDRFVRREIDDNPSYNSSFRMASPAVPEHFLRVFGQTDRSRLGRFRDRSASMRQALMIMNGRLTNEASRVGELEPIYALLAGERADAEEAVRLAYREILTREPLPAEIAEAKEIVAAGADPLRGMADVRWILMNCNEFRFLP